MQKLLTIPLLACYLVTAVVPAGFCYMSGMGLPCCPEPVVQAEAVETGQASCGCCQEPDRAEDAPAALSALPGSGDCGDMGCCAEAHPAVRDRVESGQETLAVAALAPIMLLLERPALPERSARAPVLETRADPAWASVPLYVELESFLL